MGASMEVITACVGVLSIRRLVARAPSRRGGGRPAGPARPQPKLSSTTVVGAALAGALAIVSGSPTLGACTFAIGLAVTPTVRSRVAHRQAEMQFRAALPVFVEEFARGLRGGLSPSQALTDGAPAAPRPFPEVFAPAAKLLRAGATADEAVSAWASGRADQSLRFLATAVAVGNSVGGIDGRTADAVAAVLRERTATEAIVRMQATQALWSAGVLCGAPVVFCALVVLGDPRSSAFLLHNPIGMALGLAGVTLDLLGAWWMRRLVRKVVR